MTRSVFSLGVQAGDRTADDVMGPHYRRLRTLLNTIMGDQYSQDIKEFAPVLRIDGSIWHWDREGVDNVRVSKKKSHATADIFVPASIWQSQDDATIRKYLSKQIAAAYDLIADKIGASKLDIQADALHRDIGSVISKFLRDPDHDGEGRATSA